MTASTQQQFFFSLFCFDGLPQNVLFLIDWLQVEMVLVWMDDKVLFVEKTMMAEEEE